MFFVSNVLEVKKFIEVKIVMDICDGYWKEIILVNVKGMYYEKGLKIYFIYIEC